MILSLDGVYRGPGGPDEDRRGGFERGGWTMAYDDPEMWPFLVSMFERDLVDELNIRLVPVVVGEGTRLFPERGQSHDLTLVESRSMPRGVTVLTYRPAGRATFGNAGD
jgi:hypothetical protein